MHAYRQFIQDELDARKWTPAKLATEAGMHRQTISKILKDKRDHLGAMPGDATIESIARGFRISPERVRLAAARSLAGYEDDGAPISTDLSELPLDVLFEEIRRRVESPGPGVDHAKIWPPRKKGWSPDSRQPPSMGDDQERGEGN